MQLKMVNMQPKNMHKLFASTGLEVEKVGIEEKQVATGEFLMENQRLRMALKSFERQ